MSRRSFHFHLVMIAYCAFFAGINVRGGQAWTALVMAALTVVMALIADHESRKLEGHALVEAQKVAAQVLALVQQLRDLIKRASP